jgi:exosortase/archaeosortase
MIVISPIIAPFAHLELPNFRIAAFSSWYVYGVNWLSGLSSFILILDDFLINVIVFVHQILFPIPIWFPSS